MRCLWLCVWTTTITLGILPAQPANLAEDPKLQPRVSVWLKMEPMRDALRAVSRHTGVPLRCQDAIAQEKVCVFVEDRPAHEILTQLSRLLRYEWRTHEDGGYILQVPDKTRLEEERAQSQMRAARLSALRDLQRLVREIAKLPPTQRVEQKQRLEARQSELSAAERQRLELLKPLTAFAPERLTPSGEIDRSDKSVSYYRDEAYIYLCLAALPERALSALLDGQWVGLSSKPAHGIHRFPDVLLPPTMRDHTTAQQFSEQRIRITVLDFAPRNPEFAGIWLRLLPLQGVIRYYFLSAPEIQSGYLHPDGEVRFYGNPARAVLGRMGSLSLLWSLRETVSPLWNYWDSWAASQAELSNALPERASPAPNRPAPPLTPYRPNDYYGYRYSVADALEWLAWATRRPVLSDAFRTAPLELFLKPDMSPRTLLEPLRERIWLRLDESGYLNARHKRYWELRLFEIPEAWLRLLEAKAARNELNLWDYVALAGKLNARQADYLMQTRGYTDPPLVRFSVAPLIECLPALRFLASLSEAQRAQLIAGEPLRWSQLNRPQQKRYLEAVQVEFPPAQWLFREQLPTDNPPHQDTLQNLAVSLIPRFLDDMTSEQLAELLKSPPAESMVKLVQAGKKFVPVLVGAKGEYTHYFGGYDDRGQDAEEVRAREIRRMHLELSETPDARLIALNIEGYIVAFFASDGQFARYAFALAREERFELPPLPPAEQEP
ncbi:MAG: hypothetical protein KatS3mg020_0531 [Fimbriimonadales bacterium]|nr:MAG: hypothetical protein KatS3mg020_0531 [Fimbriimonadales bacterium]